MALREKPHAAWGDLGERTNKDELILRLPKKRRKKKKKYNHIQDGGKPLTTYEIDEITKGKKSFGSRKNKISKKKNSKQKIKKKKSKTVSVRVISRAHVPAERVNRKEKQRKGLL